MEWSGHTKTGRLQGIAAKPSTKTLEKEGAWERVMHWMMGDFGYRNCPIFLVKVLGVGNNRSTVLRGALLPEERTKMKKDQLSCILSQNIKIHCWKIDRPIATVLSS